MNNDEYISIHVPRVADPTDMRLFEDGGIVVTIKDEAHPIKGKATTQLAIVAEKVTDAIRAKLASLFVEMRPVITEAYEKTADRERGRRIEAEKDQKAMREKMAEMEAKIAALEGKATPAPAPNGAPADLPASTSSSADVSA